MEYSSDKIELQVNQRAYSGRIYTFAIVNKNHINTEAFFHDAFHIYKSEIERIFERYQMIKVRSVFSVEFEKKEEREQLNSDNYNQSSDTENVKKKKETYYAPTSTQIIGFDTNLSDHFNKNVVEEVVHCLDHAHFQGSGFTITRIDRLSVEVYLYEPLGGSSYLELPKKILGKRAVVNVKNHDKMCFMWAVLSALYPAKKNAQDIGNYWRYRDELNFDEVFFPVRLNKIDKFEKTNPDISINVYYFDESSQSADEHTIRPLRVTSKVKKNHIHLLLIFDEIIYGTDHINTIAGKLDKIFKEGSIKSHYCWIKDLSRLVSSQLTKRKCKMFICDRCLNYFDKNYKLTEHIEKCTNECKIEMPTDETKWIHFKNYRNQLRAPFVVYADTEAYLKPLTTEEQNCVFSETCSTTAYQQHRIYSVGYYFKCEYDNSYSFYRSSGNTENCVTWFVKELRTITQFVAQKLKKTLPMKKLTPEQQLMLIDPHVSCFICEKSFHPLEYRVRDHCHLTGNFRGVAHSNCNLNFKLNNVVPVVIHNLSRYDAHLFIKELTSEIKGDISIIPQNSEEYISITKTVDASTFDTDFRAKIRLRFIDSFRFMPESLAKLASLIPSNKKRILYSESSESNYTSEQISMLERKGVYPYEYVDSLEKLNETSLPPRKSFRSELNDADISMKEYQFACEVWDKFHIKTLGEYTDLYLKTDVLLLADVFENFRDTCHSIYKLDPLHYYTAPGLSYDAMLKYTDIEIELFTDVEMLMFIESGIRGGISQCSKRYVKANNKYMDSDYKPEKETSYLMYLDANNLYGHAMSQPLPISDFSWVDNVNEIAPNDILNLSDDSEIGYIFEVDLHYPQSLHNLHNDFPFCPEKRPLPNEVFNILGVRKNKMDKLLLTLYDKENYVIHYRMLKLALQHGLVLKKVHRVLQFRQTCWFKKYIDLNIELRKKAESDFEKTFFKLMVNAVFGKTMENLRLRVDIKLVNKWEGKCGAGMLIARPNFKKCKIFSDDLVAIEMKQTSIKMNKPIVVGMAVLDVSKLTMYKFMYDFLKPKYAEKCRLAYTDTDSFILKLKTPDFYEDIRKNIAMFDTSDYPIPNRFDIERKNKKIPGLFKDELNGKILVEFVGLRAKCYAVNALNDKKALKELQEKKKKLRKTIKIKRAKGVKMSVVQRKIKFSDYVDCILNNCKKIERPQNTFRSINHNVYTIQQTKVALNPDDDKRYLIKPNRINTLAWGHYAIDAYENKKH